MDLELDPASDCNCMKSYKTLMCLEAVYNYLPVRANNNALLLHCRKLLDTAAIGPIRTEQSSDVVEITMMTQS